MYTIQSEPMLHFMTHSVYEHKAKSPARLVPSYKALVVRIPMLSNYEARTSTLD